jgi:putative alpha-1,2-mannosidase
MSSWLLFASLGLFPQAGTTKYLIGSPRVQQASLQLKHFDMSTSLLEIVTVNNSAENVYVETLMVNGVEHREAIVDRAVLTDPAGCRLEFHMSAVPVSSLCSK